ncbi:galactokinase [Salinimicrobium marinum]|uniref:Galactokinase n=2 Tax=Salinimicrobium marinum TaxID=680283 RepID=A0A918S8W6_9FLAO|nr:galactokinase [Salinimicrobium marinum]
MLNDFTSELSVSSPGRINLIGEHTDYNNGFVLPTAIDRKIYFEFRKNNYSNKCRIYSETFKTYTEFDPQDLSKSEASWKNYIFGVVDEIQKRGKTIDGFDCIIKSELPIGAGISSSAALECGLATGLNELFSLGLEPLELVKLSQSAENNFVGSNCGIMDQYASVMSKKGHLILLDCKSLKAEFIPADFKNCKILLLNTNVEHNLAEGEYNTRRRECEEAVKIIQKSYPEVHSLRDVNFEILEKTKHELPEKNYQRSFYVLKENERVIKATEAIKSGNIEVFGKLMYQSHEGLQHHYEVSCAELDFLVDHSRNKEFIYGSRMMGGGFGGCTINIIEENEISGYVQEVSKAYKEKFNIELDAITVVPSEGTIVEEKK